jgi:hypothetical protein
VRSSLAGVDPTFHWSCGRAEQVGQPDQGGRPDASLVEQKATVQPAESDTQDRGTRSSGNAQNHPEQNGYLTNRRVSGQHDAG